MMYADTELGRVEAAPGLKGTCPSCGHPCRPRCGQINIHHWAHHARADCDPWFEPMTEWHLGWQRAVPPERREVVMAPHRADIVTASGGVVEVQHSAIPSAVITAREEFYGPRMAWIFDATAADISINADTLLWDRQWAGQRERVGVAPYVRFEWRHPRRTVSVCRRPVFLDLGENRILRLPERFKPGREMTGSLYTRASVEGWLRDGAPFERIVPPPEILSWRPISVSAAARRLTGSAPRSFHEFVHTKWREVYG